MNNKEEYFKSFMLYCLGRLNLSPSYVSDSKKEEIIIYLKYAKSLGAKANIEEIKNIING
jgi:hypothetical protein